MALTRVNGSTTLASVEINLFSAQTTSQYYATYVYLHNLSSTSEIILRVFVRDNQSNTERLYDSQEFKGVQSVPAVFIPFIPVDGGYRVSGDMTSRFDFWGSGEHIYTQPMILDEVCKDKRIAEQE